MCLGELSPTQRVQVSEGHVQEIKASVGMDGVEAEAEAEAEANPDSDLEAASELPPATSSRPVRPERVLRGLSMDTIYMALNEAESETNDLAPEGSIPPARALSIFSPTFPSAAAAAVEREVRRREAEFPESCTASSSQRLSTLSLSPTASPPMEQLGGDGLLNRAESFVAEDLLGRGDLSLRTSMTDVDANVSLHAVHNQAHTTQAYIRPRPGFSETTSQRARAAPTALFVTNPVGLSTSDSECPSLSSSLSSGLNLPSTITAHIGGARGTRTFPLHAQSPETPESPALPTPADINASFSSMSLGSGSDSLNAIHEPDAVYGGGLGVGSQAGAERVTVMPMSDRTPRSFSPVFARAGAGLRARFGKSASTPLPDVSGGNVKYDADDGVSVIDISAGEETDAYSAQGWSFVDTTATMGRRPPASPALATFAPTESECTAGSSVESRNPYHQEYGVDSTSPRTSAHSMGGFVTGGSSTNTNSSGGRNFLSRTRNLMKLRSGEAGASSSPPSSPTTPTTFSGAGSGGKWPRPPAITTNAHIDSRSLQSRHLSIVPAGPMQQLLPPHARADLPVPGGDAASMRARAKAAKEEEKRRKKEEEKKRLEALAAQFAAGRAKGKDGASMSSGGSGGSEEKRKSNNDWLEDGGMWGASMQSGWAGL